MGQKHNGGLQAINGGKSVPVHVNLDQLEDIACGCGSLYFFKRTRVKKMSSVVSPTGREQNVYLEILICSACGRILGTEDYYSFYSPPQIPAPVKNNLPAPEPADETGNG